MLADLIDWSKLEKVEAPADGVDVCGACVFSAKEDCLAVEGYKLCENDGEEFIFIKKERKNK